MLNFRLQRRDTTATDDSSQGIGPPMAEQAESRDQPSLDSQTHAALRFCEVNELTPVVVVQHQEVEREYLDTLMMNASVAGAIAMLPEGSESIHGVGSYLVADYTWLLPPVSAKSVVVLGPRSAITYRMARAAQRIGVTWLIYTGIDSWHAERISVFIFRKYVEKVEAYSQRYLRFSFEVSAEWLMKLPCSDLIASRIHRPRSFLRYLTDTAKVGQAEDAQVHGMTGSPQCALPAEPIRIALQNDTFVPMDKSEIGFAIEMAQLASQSDSSNRPLRSPWIVLEDGVALPHPHALHDEIRAHGQGRWSHWGRQVYLSSSDGTDPRYNGRRYELICYRTTNVRRYSLIGRNPFNCLGKVVRDSNTGSSEFVENRIVLVNASLASGGAERQVVNTLCGLKRRGYSDLTLLCEHLHDRPGHDFYLWLLEAEKIQVRQIDRTPKYMVQLMAKHQLKFAAPFFSALPVNLRDEVAYFAHELLRIRPHVVHAWQDQTSIKVGLAAAMIGVPRIVLGSRNLPPYHFHYYMNYMAPAYRALARQDAVLFTNNSRRGASDYEKWLRLPSGTFRVVFNGVDDARMRRATEEVVDQYRRGLGIPDGAPVVGGMFRLYPEKDPLLWLKAARRILDKNRKAYFLLVGTGVLQSQIESNAERLGLRNRLVMPGTEKSPAVPLSAMDVFMLTSKQEGTPNVVIEAQMIGVPVVATNAGGTADALLDGTTGDIVRSRRPRDLAAAVLKWLEDDTLRMRVRNDAPDFARQRFGFEAMVDATLDTYGLPERHLNNE